MSRPIVLAVLAGTLLGLTASAAGSQAAASTPEGTITFIRGGRLFAIRPDGSGLRPLTPPSTSVWFYAWSPDATRIAYIDQGASLWLMRPDGSGRRLLLPTATLSSGSLSWSPDGTRLAIVSPGPDTIPFGPDANPRCCSKLKLYVVPVAGGPPALLPAGKHVGWGLAWSPQGDEIYYGAGAILAIHPDGTARRWISTVGYVGSLSADGRQFVFNVPLRGDGFYGAFGVVNADGTGFHVVTRYAYTEYGEVWSPTGHRILYGRADRQGIYVVGSDGRSNRRVTPDSPPQTEWPALAWSPDGGSVVYDAGDDNADLYVVGVDGRGRVRLTNTPDGEVAPSWVAR